MPSVSLYIRRKDDRYEKCGPKAVYVLGTTFVLRYELEGRRRWEKLPSGVDYATGKRMALEKELALFAARLPRRPKKRARCPRLNRKLPLSCCWTGLSIIIWKS
jgi:hypothetical protein